MEYEVILGVGGKSDVLCVGRTLLRLSSFLLLHIIPNTKPNGYRQNIGDKKCEKKAFCLKNNGYIYIYIYREKIIITNLKCCIEYTTSF